MNRMLYFFTLLACCLGHGDWVCAQQSVVGTPFASASDSFSESIGTQWGIKGPGWFFNWGGGNAVPPFGGFDPNSGLQGGFGFGGNGMRGRFGFTAAQGSTRGFSSTSPMVVVPNGGVGGIIDTNYRPFVTEIVPVVGESAVAAKLRQYGRPPYRLAADQETAAKSSAENSKASLVAETNTSSESQFTGQSSAARGSQSLAEIRRQLAAEDATREAELAAILASADQLESAGDKSAAASQYAKAAYRVEGSRRQELLLKARTLRQK
jgi:hypothetical protein